MSAPEFAAMYELLVVGSRGSGLSDRLLGSTARALASGCPVPVLMVSAARGGMPRRPDGRRPGQLGA